MHDGLFANLDTCNVLCSLEVLTSALKTVSLLQDQQGGVQIYDLLPVCLESRSISNMFVNYARDVCALRAHTSIIHEVFRHFSKRSALFAKIDNYAASAFLCFFDCFFDAKDQVRTAVDLSESVSLLYSESFSGGNAPLLSSFDLQSKVGCKQEALHAPSANIGPKNVTS